MQFLRALPNKARDETKQAREIDSGEGGGEGEGEEEVAG